MTVGPAVLKGELLAYPGDKARRRTTYSAGFDVSYPPTLARYAAPGSAAGAYHDALSSATFCTSFTLVALIP